MYRNTYPTTVAGPSYSVTVDSTWAIVLMALAFAVALLIFFLIVKRKTRPEGGFMRFLHDALNFRSLIIDDLIKFFYIFSTILFSIYMIIYMFSGVSYAPLYGLIGLLLGNIALRVLFEFVMMLIGIWTNTTGIHRMMEENSQREKKSEKK